MKRPVEVVVLSDLHLGTIGCHAVELLQYLNSIQPRILVLNGDIIDIWNFKKYYWPEAHMQVVKTLLTLMSAGTEVYYLTGNHDEVLRKISTLQVGPLHIKDKLVLEVNGKKCWIFHGDIFDITMKQSKWLAKVGGFGYDILILLNRAINSLLDRLGRGKISISRRIKDGVKKAVKFIDDFEMTAMELAIDHGYKYVVCGHIHQPKIREYANAQGEVVYLNSGDWIENLTALEFDGKDWSLYRYSEDHFENEDIPIPAIEEKSLEDILLMR